MRTVTNLLETHLLIPDEAAHLGVFKMPPRGAIAVKAVTGALRNAERNGLVSIVANAPPVSPEPPEVPEMPEDTKDLTPQVVTLVSEGKSQREIGNILGVSRNEVYNILRRHRAAAAKE